MLRRSVLAGVFIGIGACVNLNVGGVYGAILFAFGLLAIVHYGLPLYTGKAGFVERSGIAHLELLAILGLNVGGCLLVSLVIGHNEFAVPIVNARDSMPWHEVLLKAMPCGLIMTAAVEHARRGKYLPLVFGVPTFILCGFPHCVADAAYYCMDGRFLFFPWLMAVIGNYVGCNIYRLAAWKIK